MQSPKKAINRIMERDKEKIIVVKYPFKRGEIA